MRSNALPHEARAAASRETCAWSETLAPSGPWWLRRWIGGTGAFAFSWGVVLAIVGLAQVVLAVQGHPLPVRGGRGGGRILVELPPPAGFAFGALLLAFGLATAARVVAVVFGREEWIVAHAEGIEGRIGRRRIAIATRELVAARLDGRRVVVVWRDAEGRPQRIAVHGSRDPAGLCATLAKIAK